jgi:hypothetical protein
LNACTDYNITFVSSTLKYSSVIWNSITSTDAKILERNQQKFAALHFNCFFPQAIYCYSFALGGGCKIAHFAYEEASVGCFFIIQICLLTKFCSSVLETLDFRVPARSVRDFALFNVWSLSENVPSARRPSAAKDVCWDVDIFEETIVLHRI